MSNGQYDSKSAAREATWNRLEETGVARFPFPVEGRIPNFADADRAAKRLIEHSIFEGAKAIKVNPDSPQKPLRRKALEHGIDVYVPTPRLKGGFMHFDPESIPPESYPEAAALSKWDAWRQDVELEDLPEFDLIVAGSVAVTAEGRRAGKGHGYSDLEFAILGELGHPSVPIVTTVHEYQVVESLPTEPHDIKLSFIATPERIIDTGVSKQEPGSVDWERLSEKRIEKMPILNELKTKK